jgi:hypothetical protein
MRTLCQRALPLFGFALFASAFFASSQTAASVETCDPIFKTRAATSAGIGVAGTAQISYVPKERNVFSGPIKLDSTTDASGNVTVCNITAEQIDELIEIGFADEQNVSNKIKFSFGDLITVLYKQASSSGSKFVYAEYVLTAENVKSLDANKVVNFSRIDIGSGDQFSQVVKSSGQAVASANWSLSKITDANPDGDELLLFGETGSSGNLQLSGLPNGEYFMSFTPTKLSVPSGSTGGAMPGWEPFLVQSGVATFTNHVDGLVNLPSATGSLRLKFQPNTGPVRDLSAAELSSLGIELSNIFWQSDSIAEDSFFKVLSDGNVVLDLPPGEYLLNTRADPTIAKTTLANTYFMAIVSADNGSRVMKIFPGSSNSRPEDFDGQTPLGTGVLNVREATISWNYTNFHNWVDRFDQFQLFQVDQVSEQCQAADDVLNRSNGCNDSLDFLMNRGSGVTSLNDGTYWFYHYPSDEFGEPAGVTLLNFTLETTGGVQKIFWNKDVAGQDGTAVVSSAGTSVLITAPRGNVRVKVLDSSGKLFGYARATISCDSNLDCGEFPQSDRLTPQTSKSGYLEGSVSKPGSYKLVITPYRDNLLNSASEFSFVVDVAGKVTDFDDLNSSSTYDPVQIDPESNTWQVKLRAPSVSGRVMMPGGSTSPVPWAIVGWDCNREDGATDVGMAMADGNGNFGLSFKPGPGWCGVEAGPNWDTRDAVTTRFNILIDALGKTCLKLDDSQTECESSPAPGEFELRLKAPNVTGQVKINNGALPNNAYVYAEFATFGQDIRTSITSGIDYLGRFQFNASFAGDYELKLTPNGLSGFGETVRYVKAETGEDGILRLCLAANNDGFLECLETPTPASKLEFNVNLDKANFAFTVNLAVGVEPPSDLWGSMYPVDNFGNQNTQNWSDRKQLGISGRSGFVSIGKLEAPTPYALEIEPNYYGNESGTLPLASKLKKYFWIGDFGGQIKSCQVTSQQLAEMPASCVGESLIGPTIPIQLTMSPGNVSGTVTVPGGGSPIPYSYGNIRKWSAQSNNWEYVNDGWFNSDPKGRFSLNLEPGTYKVTAQKGWGTRETYVPGNQIIVVESEKACLKPDSFAPQPNGDTCLDDDASATSFKFKLRSPNISGTISSKSGVNVTGTWVQLYEIDGHNRIFVDSTNVSKNGKFGFNVTLPSEYLIVAEPNSFRDKKGAVTTTSDPFSVICNPDCSTEDDQLIDVELEAPNVVGKVCVAGTAQNWCSAAAGVSVSVSSGGEAQQTTNTDSNGMFSFRLDDPSLVYDLELTPWNGSSVGAAISTDLVLTEVEPEVWENPTYLECTGTNLLPTNENRCDDLQIELASPNLKGSLTFNDFQSQMSWAWITLIADDDNYNYYGNSDQSGDFSFLVADGRYTLTAYANTSIANKAPLVLNVIVSGGSVTNWDYASRASFDYLEQDGSIYADYDYVPPNVSISMNDASNCTGKRLVLIEHAIEMDRIVILEAGTASLLTLTEEENYDLTVLPNVDDGLLTNNGESISVLLDENKSQIEVVFDIGGCSAGE